MSPETDDEERLFGGPAGRLLLAASLGWGTIQAGRLVLSPLLPTIMVDLAITEVQAGVALTLLWALYALGQYPSGRLSDRLSRSTLLVGGLGLLLVGFLVLYSATGYPRFLLGAAVVGAGAGLYPTAARALVSDLYVARRGQAFGLHTASGDSGGAIAAGIAVAAIGLGAWNLAFLPVMATLVVVLVLLHAWRTDPYDLSGVELAVGATARRLLAVRRLRGLLVAYVLYAFAWQASVGFLPTLLQRTKDFSPALAGGGFAALFVVGAAVKPVSGGLGDRIAKPLVAAGGLGLAAVALIAVLAFGDPLAISAAVVVFAAGLMAVPPVLQAYLMDVFPTESMGGDLGAMRGVYIGIGSLGPTYVGVVAHRASYAAAFGGIVACLLASAALVVWLGRQDSGGA